jgi:uncharacterized protein YaeQ
LINFDDFKNEVMGLWDEIEENEMDSIFEESEAIRVEGFSERKMTPYANTIHEGDVWLSDDPDKSIATIKHELFKYRIKNMLAN